MDKERFSEIGRVEAIRRLYEGSGFEMAEAGSFKIAGPGRIGSWSRLFIEGIDFSLIYFPLRHLGYKCVSALAGEVYASFSHPRSLDVKIGVSAKLDFSQISELWQGITTAASEHRFLSLSLDLLPSPNGLTIAVSATGEESKLQESRRPEAKSKDLLCVSGSLGAAYFGLSLLEKERKNFEKTGKDESRENLEKYKMFVADYLKPQINPGTVNSLEDEEIVPSAGVLVTRGLSDAIKRISAATGLGVKVYASMIPFEGNSFDLGKEMGIDPVSAAMNGGDDYRLLFTIPILKAEKVRRDFQTFDVIGHLAQKDVGTVLVTPEGAEFPVHAQGWKEKEEDE